VDLYGSLAATGRGHGTDKAVLGGLHGWTPEDCDVEAFATLPETLAEDPRIPWGDGATEAEVRFVTGPARYADLPHPNTMTLRADDFEQTWCSVGGGFISLAENVDDHALSPAPATPPRHPYHDAVSLVAQARAIGGSFGDVGFDLLFSDADEADVTTYGISVDYTTGDITWTAAVVDDDSDGSDTDFGVGVSLDLGGGLAFGAGLGSVDDDTVADAGFTMAF